MKQRTRLLSVLLTLVLLLSLIPATAYATNLYNMATGVLVGETFDLTPVLEDIRASWDAHIKDEYWGRMDWCHSHLYIESVSGMSNAKLSMTADKSRVGKSAEPLKVSDSTAKGYCDTQDGAKNTLTGVTLGTVTIRGYAVSVYKASYMLSYDIRKSETFTYTIKICDEFQVIKNADLTIDKPVAGEFYFDMSKTALAGKLEHCELYNTWWHGVLWADHEDIKNGFTFESPYFKQYGTFEAGHSYWVAIPLRAEAGYRFSIDAEKECNFTINGQKAALLVTEDNGRKGYIAYQFAELLPVLDGRVQLTSAANPGKSIGIALTGGSISDVPSGNLIYQWQVQNGSAWTDIPGSAAKIRNYVPAADQLGKSIRLVVTAKGYEGSVASDGITVSNASVAPLITINDLAAPTHGKAADYTASVSVPNCTITKISYTMFKKVLDPYVGSRGDNIGIEVTVKAASGYAFPAGTKAAWNGVESYSAAVSAAGDECVYLFPYSVGAEDSAILKNLSFTVAAPAVGKAPAATVSAPQGVTVESVAWTPADTAFKEGVSYTVKIGFQADSTHVLADDFLNTGTVTINGQSAQLSKPTTGGIKDTFLTTCYASFTFPALKAGEQPVSPDRTNPFTDVKESDYFYNPVLWAVEKEVTNGTSATTFSPSRTCTRAQIITFLWRASGSPEPGITCSFLDVPAGSYYEKAVTWATEQGMVEGDQFYPNDPCTRLMAVEFMWAQAGRPKAPAASFEDVNSPAVDWAVEAGVTNGTSATKFSPDKTCTRGQIVTFLWRAFGA